MSSRSDSPAADRSGPSLAAAWRAGRAVLGTLPGLCEVCRDGCAGAICATCTERFAAPLPRCRRCGLRTGAPADRCGRCLPDAGSVEATVCVADYGPPWDGLVAALKFHQRPELALPLAELLAAAVRRQGPSDVDLVLPVPLSPARLAERGYNQAWELARRVAAALGVPAEATLLQRLGDQAHQSGLDRRARLANLRHAFWVPPAARTALQGRRIALVDDVMTTGATLQEAAGALRRAGATTVHAWVLARTPEPGT